MTVTERGGLSLLFEVDGGGGSVESVTGLNTNNTDPANPVVQISVDGVTITGDGTPGSPLIAPQNGNVSTVSVVSANGFAGTVADPTTTPAITLSTTITGLLKGNGTAISAAQSGTDYVTSSSINTFTNKTFDADGTGNSISNIENADIKAAAAIAVNKLAAITPSRITISDGSGFILGADTATYPSLTELSYVKGVTSAIQTQIDAKGSGTVTSVTGTSNRITSTGGTTPVIDISASYVGQSSITTTGTVTSGTWSGLFGAVSGANLTNLTAANISAGTAGIDISGTSAISTTGTVANEATDTTCFPLFATAATGNLGLKSNAALKFNSSTGALGTTGLTLGTGSLSNANGYFMSAVGIMTDSVASSPVFAGMTAVIQPTADSAVAPRTFSLTVRYDSAFNTGTSGINAGTAGYFENRVFNSGTINELHGSTHVGLMGASATGATLGNVTTVVGAWASAVQCTATPLTATITTAIGFKVFDSVKTNLTITGQAGLNVVPLDEGVNNTSVLLGTATVPTGNFSIYNAARTINDIAGAGTAAIWAEQFMGIPTYTATNARTYTDAATSYIQGAPVASTNVTITRPWAFWIDGGASRFDGDIGATGFRVPKVWATDIESTNAPSVNGTAATGASGGLALAGTPSFTTTIGVGAATASASGAGITFPATQSASTDANTLDDYEEGDWTPTFTFLTPGDLSITYSQQTGSYTKIGRQVTAHFSIITSAFTHTTASGAIFIQTLPFTSRNSANNFYFGAIAGWRGVTKANFICSGTQVSSNSTSIEILVSGSAQVATNLAAADMPTGGTVLLRGSVTYFT